MRNIFYSLILFSVPFVWIQCTSSEEGKTAEFVGEPIAVQVNQSSADASSHNFVSATGRLASKNSVNVSTRMMGHITSMPISVGQSVKAGQQLVAINSTDIQAKGGQVNAQIQQAQANFEVAQKDYDRFKNLFESGSATQKELDDMTARLKMASAGLEAAQQMKNEVNAQYSYTNITAPISGVVTAKYAELGDMANPGMPLLTIESPSVLQAQVLVPEQYITQVQSRMKVKVLLRSSGKEVDGVVSEISKSAINTGGQYIVKVDLQNSQDMLPGMLVTTRFPIEFGSNDSEALASSVLIPESAVYTNGQLRGVYVVSNQETAVLRWLKLGRKIGDQVEVLSGLKSDETYIISADGKLYNGAKVNIQ